MLERIRSYTCHQLLSPLLQIQTWNITCVNYITFSFIRRKLQEIPLQKKAVIISINVEITVCSYFNGKPDLTIIGFVNALFPLNYVIMKIRFYYFDQRK